MNYFDINEAVKSMMKMVSRLIGENVRSITELDQSGVIVYGDESKLEQVVMNLVVNACDAMPDGGSLTIRTMLETFDQHHHDARLKWKESDAGQEYVRPSVIDSGIGMDEKTKARLFEPFFTTKGREKGTGLGLPIVLGIVESHGG